MWYFFQLTSTSYLIYFSIFLIKLNSNTFGTELHCFTINHRINSSVKYIGLFLNSIYRFLTYIPERIFIKAPTAELRPNQKDQDSLPPYEVLDDILEGLIEKDLGVQDIVAHGHDSALVKRVWSMLDRAEYKRRQAPPGVKITSRTLGKDRRYPITNCYREMD